MKKNKEVKIEDAIKELSSERKSSEDIVRLMQNYMASQEENLKKMKEHAFIHDTGGDLEEDEYGKNKVIMKIAKRFCKVHASYVMKDHPNIRVSAKNEEVPESNQLAASTQKSLLLWWREQQMTRKIKRAVRKASYKGKMIFYISRDKENETFSFNVLDPEYAAYERVTDDPTSPLIWFAKGMQMNTAVAKKLFPKHENEIQTFKASKFFTMNGKSFNQYNFINDGNSFYYEFMDSKYLYKYVNDVEVDVQEHGYPFIPFYVFYYFDLDSPTVTTLIDFIHDPIKMINQVFGYRIDFTSKHSDPPLMVRGKNNEIDPDKLNGSVLEVKEDGDAKFISPQANAIDSERMLELTKAFLHFLSGLSEEAMAGFTGSLTAAGVSIELRLDSTVREALDTQVILQEVLQQINRDYLKLSEEITPNRNMLKSKLLGITDDREFKGSLIAGLYDNTVDFGGILPRSQDQIVRNTVTKFSSGMISLETALREMNYPDPTLELAKIRTEAIERSELEKIMQQGGVPKREYLETPEKENSYLIETGKITKVHPDQDHEYHMMVHQKVMDKLSEEPKSLLALHIQTHRSMMEQQ